MFVQGFARVAFLTFVATVLSCAYYIDVVRKVGRTSYYCVSEARGNMAAIIGLTCLIGVLACFMAGVVQHEENKSDISQFYETRYSSRIECPHCNTVNNVWQENGKSWTELEGFECGNCKLNVLMSQCNGYRKAVEIHKNKAEE